MKNVKNLKSSKKEINKIIDSVLKEKRKVFYDVFYEALEDYALLKAMKEADTSKRVSKKRIFKILNGQNES